jgi:uncharacterized lipoprotein
MKSVNRSSILIGFFIVATIFYYGCAHTGQQKQSIYPDGIVCNQPYEKVWRAVNDLIFIDLGCLGSKVNKKKGTIETEWVAQITPEGTMRWRVFAKLKQKGTGTRVILSKEVEKKEEPSQFPYRSKEKEREKDRHPQASWQYIEVAADSIDRLYQQLQNKLK